MVEKEEHVMQRFLPLALSVLLIALTCTAVWGDIPVFYVTKVYFDQGGKPYRKPVKFTVTCFGYRWKPGPPVRKEPGTYTPEEVFSFSAECPDYGCEIRKSFYMNYRHIDYCDLAGETEGRIFRVERYAQHPAGQCEFTTRGQACLLKIVLPD